MSLCGNNNPCPDLIAGQKCGITYTGARYVPLFADPAQWDNTKAYEPLTIVLNEGNSYTSKTFVPVGVDISNEKYWALTGNYNAQVESYRKEVEVIKNELTTKQSKTFIDLLDDYNVSGNDITSALTQAVSDVAVSGKIFIKNGTYIITSPISINKSLTIEGEYTTSQSIGTIINVPNGDGFLITSNNVTIKCLNLVGDNVAGSKAINVQFNVASSNCKFYDIYCNKFETGFKCIKLYFSRFQNCRSLNCETGFDISGGITTFEMNHCWCLYCTTGYQFNECSYSVFNNCAADSCGNSYNFNNCKAITLNSCASEVSTDLPVILINSSIEFNSFYGYKNNSNLTSDSSVGTLNNSSAVFTNISDVDLKFKGENEYCKKPFTISNNSTLGIIGGITRFDSVADETSIIYGQYNKDGGFRYLMLGDIKTLPTDYVSSNLGDMTYYVTQINNFLKPTYSSNAEIITTPGVYYFSSSATPLKINGICYINKTDDGLFYFLIGTTGKLGVGAKTGGAGTITWHEIDPIS